MAVVDSVKESIPQSFLLTLIAAEDHRNFLHYGIDTIGILRAANVSLRQGKTQGASTIEQQFVRVVTGRYERTPQRKIREQILAIALSRQKGKLEIASAYLSIAFYGTGCIGITGLQRYCGNDLTLTDKIKIRKMVARLKYPKPLCTTEEWEITLNNRVNYIERRENEIANNCIQLTPSSAVFHMKLVGYSKIITVNNLGR
jgi:penicillin-binding protein 1A